MSVDPVPAAVAWLAIAWLFAHAAWHKIRAFGEFTTVLASYRLLPAGLVRVVALLLAAIELAVAVGAAAGAAPAFVGAAALLGLYSSAIAVNLLRDRALIDCGCGGPPQPVTWWLVARNVTLIAVAAVALLPTTGRALGPLDAVTIAAALFVAGGVYATVNALHAARAALEEWI